MIDHRQNIEHIFDALQVGIESAENPAEDFERPEDINPDTFNRATLTIDGEVYTVSVFRGTSQQNIERDHTFEESIEFKRDYPFNASEMPEGWRKSFGEE